MHINLQTNIQIDIIMNDNQQLQILFVEKRHPGNDGGEELFPETWWWEENTSPHPIQPSKKKQK